MIKKIIYVLLFISNYSMANFEILQKGISVTDKNINELATTSWEYAKSSTTQKKFNDGFANAFFMKEGTIDLYSLSDKPALYLTNFETREVLGNWPLTPWANAVRMKGEGITWRVRGALSAVKGGDFIEINDPETQVLDTNKQYKISNYQTSVGCLNQTPLRYGDIDNNASTELILLLNNDLVIFSPVLKKIIFAMTLSDTDELKPERVADWFLDETKVNPQFVADSGTNNLIKAALPATRSFAKVFLDDFNTDGKKDIIVWRKLYESNLKTNPELGFSKVADLLVHYSLVDGEYQIQSNTPPVEGEFETDPTQQAKIKNWLDSKNLTWQKGFPSKSECAGQEGQLIPEMHDSLLNDPDVLK
ncbi:hypothetical protein ACU6U9_05850 [Pseudomonas sp. HK3]